MPISPRLKKTFPPSRTSPGAPRRKLPSFPHRGPLPFRTTPRSSLRRRPERSPRRFSPASSNRPVQEKRLSQAAWMLRHTDSKVDEIARILGSKPNTVKSLLKRGREKLKEIYGGDDDA